MDTISEILTLGSAIASIGSFVLGFFIGGPFWKAKGIKLGQKQTQVNKKGGIRQSQEQNIKI